MNIQDIQTLFDYTYWANKQILDASARISAEQFVAPPSADAWSLRTTLVHTLDGARAWRMLCQNNTLAGFGELTDADFPTVESIVALWNEEERAMRDYLSHLTDADMTSRVRYTTDEGDKRDRSLWHCLYQVLNHGTQHRSEAAMLLTQYGASPGELDFTVFLNQKT